MSISTIWCQIAGDRIILQSIIAVWLSHLIYCRADARYPLIHQDFPTAQRDCPARDASKVPGPVSRRYHHAAGPYQIEYSRPAVLHDARVLSVEQLVHEYYRISHPVPSRNVRIVGDARRHARHARACYPEQVPTRGAQFGRERAQLLGRERQERRYVVGERSEQRRGRFVPRHRTIVRSPSRGTRLTSSPLVRTPVEEPTFPSPVDAAIAHRIDSRINDPLGDRERVVEVRFAIKHDGPRRDAALHRRPFRRSLEASMTLANAAHDDASPLDGTFSPGQETQQRGLTRC